MFGIYAVPVDLPVLRPGHQNNAELIVKTGANTDIPTSVNLGAGGDLETEKIVLPNFHVASIMIGENLKFAANKDNT